MVILGYLSLILEKINGLSEQMTKNSENTQKFTQFTLPSLEKTQWKMHLNEHLNAFKHSIKNCREC